jgi:hypothetical protein
MTENPPPVTTIPDALSCPEDTGPLLKWLAELTTLECLTAHRRAEMAAAAELLRTRTITFDGVWKLLLLFRDDCPSSSADDSSGRSKWLASMHADRQTIWANLTALMEGREPTLKRRPGVPLRERVEFRVSLGEQWLGFILHQLVLLMKRYYVRMESVVDGLPDALTDHIRHALATERLGGPYIMGASLNAVAIREVDAFGGNGEDVYVLKTLTTALAHELDERSRAEAEPSPNYPHIAETSGRVVFWWYWLKGFVYDLVYHDGNSGLLKRLLDHPELVDLIKQTLRDGLAVKLLNQPMTPMWMRDGDHPLDNAICELPIEDLLVQLNELLAQGRQEASRGARGGYL